MARSRNLKPGLFKNEILGQADPLYTLLFEGLWLLADREGRLEDRPLRIKAEIFPYREGLNVDAMLTWLVANGFVRRYKVDGAGIVQVIEFVKHQNPHKNESPSELPSWDERDATEPEPVRSTSEKIGSTPADSLSLDSLSSDSPNLIPCVASGSAFANPAATSAVVGLFDGEGGLPPLPPAPPAPSPAPEPATTPPAPAPTSAPAATGRKKTQPKDPAPSVVAFEAYSEAYERRYGQPPVRNAKVNGQFAQLVTRLRADEAPPVAAFYVGHSAQRYVANGHSPGLLLMDAEKLRTEWASGRRVMARDAAEADRLASEGGMWSRVSDRFNERQKAREGK